MTTATPEASYHQPVAFVPLLKQPHLPHQFDLKFCLVRTRIRVACNCGWKSVAEKPEDERANVRLRDYYQAHLLAEGMIEKLYEGDVLNLAWL